MNEVPSWFLWINLAAIFLGPVLAVIVAQYLQGRFASFNRRMSVFRDLMRHRRMTLNTDYVGALNLVEVEFSKFPEVISRWKDLYEHLYNPTPQNADEDVLRAWNERTDRLHILLIHAIARTAKLPIEQLDILAGYRPRGWDENENVNRDIRLNILSILKGHTPLNIAPFNSIEPDNPWPPKP